MSLLDHQNGGGPATDNDLKSITHAVRGPSKLRPLEGTDSEGAGPRLPKGGENLFGFRLRTELGRGAFACVYLAEQDDLARRPVVLKISAIAGNEPQTLAQLQHTHIVPIYSVHEDPQIGLRAVCMPYFGGTSLANILQTLFAETRRPMQGAEFVRALKTSQHSQGNRVSKTECAEPSPSENTKSTSVHSPSSLLDPQSSATAPLALLVSQSYIRASAWVVARLAEAVHHAHERGVLHRDVKPSNVLISGEGQPMLLDFNVSQNLHDEQSSAVLGGTVAYMAPEHLRALATRDPELARLVDRRADVYSLGMVLYEMLAGCRPFDQSGSYSPLLSQLEAMALERARLIPSLRENRPDIPWSLESICGKCLDPDPARRYQQAEDLAEDLRRFLEDQPLAYAPELSWAERVSKWMRRHPRLTSSGSVATVAALFLVAAGATLAGVHSHLVRTRSDLQVAVDLKRNDDYEDGTARALCLVNTVPVHELAANAFAAAEVEEHLRKGVEVCEKTLSLFNVLGSVDWQQDPDWLRLTDEKRRQLAEDTRELLLSLAWARVRLTPEDMGVLRGALDLLARAEAITGLEPLRALREDRAWYWEKLGQPGEAKAARERAERTLAVHPRDHYMLATTYSRKGRYLEAVRELDEAIKLNPRHYWSFMQRGICHQELGKLTLAASDFGKCVGLWPEFAWGHFNLGCALDHQGEKQQAIDSYSAALERAPDLLLVHLNRGLARLELRDYEPALADFQEAIKRGWNAAPLHAGCGAALEGLGRHEEADAAFRTAFSMEKATSKEVQARLRLVYGFAVATRLAKEAERGFDEALQLQPNHPQALYGRAMLLANQGRERDAILFFSRALEANPGFLVARRFRAVLLARIGEFDRADQDINWCLDKEPTSAATLYAAACVLARALERSSDQETKQSLASQALGFLNKALARGYGRDHARTDPDLAALRQHPEFMRSLSSPTPE
jgi:serine/threonine protein kinase/Flp pilus assembly protein TadD